jgi:hypothetical protein
MYTTATAAQIDTNDFVMVNGEWWKLDIPNVLAGASTVTRRWIAVNKVGKTTVLAFNTITDKTEYKVYTRQPL